MSNATYVREILEAKECKEIIDIEQEELVFEALRLMAINEVGALVVRESGKFVGLITERDYARKVILCNRSSRDTRVGEIMERQVNWVSLSNTAEECIELMTTHRTRYLLVNSHGRLAGLISIGDVLKALLADREHMITALTQYVTDSYREYRR